MKSQEEIQKALFVISEALGFEPVDLDKKEKEPEPLPCPFCGWNKPFVFWVDEDTDFLFSSMAGNWIVQCPFCSSLSFREEKDCAIIKWNTRTKSV